MDKSTMQRRSYCNKPGKVYFFNYIKGCQKDVINLEKRLNYLGWKCERMNVDNLKDLRKICRKKKKKDIEEEEESGEDTNEEDIEEEEEKSKDTEEEEEEKKLKDTEKKDTKEEESENIEKKQDDTEKEDADEEESGEDTEIDQDDTEEEKITEKENKETTTTTTTTTMTTTTKKEKEKETMEKEKKEKQFSGTIIVFFFGYGYRDQLFLGSSSSSSSSSFKNKSLSFDVFSQEMKKLQKKNNALILFTNTCFEKPMETTIEYNKVNSHLSDVFHFCTFIDGTCDNGSLMTHILLNKMENLTYEFDELAAGLAKKINNREKWQKDWGKDKYYSYWRCIGVVNNINLNVAGAQ